MKIPSERRTSADASYAPYSVTSPRSFHPPALPRQKSSSSSKASKNPLPTPPLVTASSGGGVDANQPQYKVARAISSCTRCRSRKQKCDGKLPACSACERAKVECIGFDAISKTNISRNYLHSLEQEVTSLRAQVAALTSSDPIGFAKGRIAAEASEAVSSFRSDFPIDPALLSDEPPLRSPYDSPGQLPTPSGGGHHHHHHHQRRHSDYPFPTGGLGGLDSPRSPFPGGNSSAARSLGQAASLQATSLTRMVHDAALRTGHAANSGLTNNPTGSNASGSDRGSSVHGLDSPVGHTIETSGDNNHTSPGTSLTPKSANAIPNSNGPSRRSTTNASPLATSASLSVSSGGKSKRRTFAIPPLPPQPAVERLVAAFVDFVGVTGPIIHIPSLGKQLMKMREGTDVEESDVFVVMMVLALSTMASSRFVDPPNELRACSEAFHAEAMKHLDAVFEEQSYIGLQAILLLVWYSLLNPDKGSIWFLVGLATRTCVDLGYHNEHNVQVEQLDALELDMRRRLFWCTYKMDRLLSQSLGRPPSIPDGFINVPLPSALHDVDIHNTHYGPLTGETCSYKAVFLHTIKLRQLQSEILFNTYGVHGSTGRIPSEEWAEDCFRRLKEWLTNSPEPRGTVSSEGYSISFHNSCLLLFRPSPGCPRPGRKALSTVLSSSGYIIRIYRRMQLNDRISWLWMTSHFSFMAGLSFLYAYFNLYSMGGGRDVPSIDDAMMDIDSCLGVLEYLAPRVPSASACHETMRNLSQAIFEQLSKLEPPETTNSTTTSPRNIRGAPISSSREDPLPNEAFPTPLPAVTLPYELSLLDNLFRNPMASHDKASEYTSNKGPKARKGAVKEEHGIGFTPAPQGFPPGVFHTPSGVSSSHAHGFGGGSQAANNSAFGDPNTLLGTFGIVAQMGMGTSPSANGNGNGPIFNSDHTSSSVTDPTTTSTGHGDEHAGPGGGEGMGSGVHSMLNGGGATPTAISNNGASGEGEGMGMGFDIFSFLMDEEGGLGGGNYALDVPADFSLWS
ncbi:hypothetical protein CI109_103089 [Kwoniella shandongensis]|uniref:Uncharacterized protein n=1 Tax=Kwoniella shandongensis TaxID=1734106 RepID=A0A5M6CE84_9TREE|nr:uncharacterized protein CI109_000280 [Kwoniella shandongensis]KAA5531439.1 hypothetical protein CI109_000280 [Kwoniella shandongensis]